jgi:hypothetical protein
MIDISAATRGMLALLTIVLLVMLGARIGTRKLA